MNRSNMELRKRVFFYAEDDVNHYDDDADLNTPNYGVMHAFARKLTYTLLSERGIGATPDHPFVFLDIGSGTGASSLHLLETFPSARLIALDLCQPMHHVLERKANAALGEESARERIRYLTADVADTESVMPLLKKALADLGVSSSLAFVVSGLALHHLSGDEKAAVYHMLYRNLADNGFLLNADFFGFRDPLLQSLAQSNTIEWIRAQHNPATTTFPGILAKLGAAADDICSKWVEHCDKYNILLPIESGLGSAQERGDFDHLFQAGFSRCECPYRDWQTAIVYATCGK